MRSNMFAFVSQKLLENLPDFIRKNETSFDKGVLSIVKCVVSLRCVVMRNNGINLFRKQLISFTGKD